MLAPGLLAWGLRLSSLGCGWDPLRGGWDGACLGRSWKTTFQPMRTETLPCALGEEGSGVKVGGVWILDVC